LQEWIDDSTVYEIDDGEDEENFPEITQQSVSQQSLSSQNYHCSILEENSPKESLNNNNDNCNDYNGKSLTKIKTSALKTPISVVNNASYISVMPISKSIAIKKGVRSELRMKRVDCIKNRSDLTNARIGSALVALRIL